MQVAVEDESGSTAEVAAVRGIAQRGIAIIGPASESHARCEKHYMIFSDFDPMGIRVLSDSQ